MYLRRDVFFSIICSSLLFVLADILRLPDCNKFDAAWTEVHPGKILTSRAYSLLSNISYHECATKCMLYPKCKNISVKEDGSLCMLHHSRHGENGTSLEVKNGWTHVETDNHMSNLGPFCRTHKPCQCRCVDTCDDQQHRCPEDNWKLQASNVCFGAKNDKFGEFRMQDGGKLLKLKLVHIGEPSLTCWNGGDFPGSKWGCNLSPEKIATAITYADGLIFLPNNYHETTYLLPGYNGNSPFLSFNVYDTNVMPGEEFRIWYIEDLINISEWDNGGTSCVDVYAVICS